MIFSVIIPTYRRHQDLCSCLDGLAHHFDSSQTSELHGQVEVIVSDDAKEADLKTLLADRYPWCRYVEGPSRGPAANRNHGAKNAKGDWLVFIDDDCVPSPAWLEGYRTQTDESSVAVIEGKTIIPNKIDSPFHHGVENLAGGCFWSCNLAVRRSVFMDIGGFDEDFLEAGGEDMELAWQFEQRGLHCVFQPNALVLHPQRRYSAKGFLKRVPLLRWAILYRLKTDQTYADRSTFHAIVGVITGHLRTTTHRTARQVLGKTGDDVRTRWFNLIWSWIVMPYQLPLVAYWEVRFRRHMTAGLIRKERSPLMIVRNDNADLRKGLCNHA